MLVYMEPADLLGSHRSKIRLRRHHRLVFQIGKNDGCRTRWQQTESHS